MGQPLSYEVAYLLKVAKFDFPVRACYVRKYDIEKDCDFSEPKLLFNDTMRKAHTKNYNDERHCADRPKIFCSAPTGDEAMEWLRSKGYMVVITPFTAAEWTCFDWDVYEKGSGLILRSPLPLCTTFEKAQESSIRATVETMLSDKNKQQ